jgi:DNA-binding NtrC family response regulator
MKKILVIEDDDNKYIPVENFLMEIYDSQVNIIHKKSFQSGMETLYSDSFDLLILDMSIPNFDVTELDDGGDTLDRGGEFILEEMFRENIVTKAIILTQYEEFKGVSLAEIDENLKKDFEDSYMGCVSYNTGYDNWKNELFELLKNNALC